MINREILDYLSKIAIPHYDAVLLPFIPSPEPGQTARLVISGPRGCGKTTVLRARAAQAAREILDCANKPLADVLLPLAETPLYLDLRQWPGALLDMVTAMLGVDASTAAQILRGPLALLLDHTESLPPGGADALGAQLASFEQATIWLSWRELPGCPLPGWLKKWQHIPLGDWSDDQVLHAISTLLGAEATPDVARWLANDRPVWQAAHRPLCFDALTQTIRANASRRPTRAELALQVLSALLDTPLESLRDWLDRAGFGACRLAWTMVEQDTETLPIAEAARVMQESGGVTLDALVAAGALAQTGKQVTFDQPLIAGLCAAWYARARPERFGGGESATLGRAGRARALHHALDIAEDKAKLLHIALDVSAPVEIFQAAAGWLMSLSHAQARETLNALAHQVSPEVVILLSHALNPSPLAGYAAELARASLRTTKQGPGGMPGPAAPPGWPALYRAGDHMLRASVEAAAGRTDAARHSAQAALAANTSAAAWSAHELGTIMARQGEAASALSTFEFAISLQPEEPAHHVQAGLAALDQNDTAQAVAHLNHALELAPNDGAILLALAKAMARSGQMEQAQQRAQQAATLLLPDDAAAWHRLSQVYANVLQKIEALRRSVRLLPAQADWHVQLAQIYLDANQPQNALTACRNALIFCPDSPMAHYGLGQACLRLGEPAQATHHLTLVSHAKDASIDDIEFHLLYAEAMARTHKIAEATFLYEHVLNVRPGDLRAAVGLARLYAEHERAADAQAILDWTLGRDANHPASLTVKGLLEEQRGDLAQAARIYAQALAGAEDVSLRLRRARLCRQLGWLDEAAQEAARCGESADALRELARIYLAQQQPQSAIECLRRVPPAEHSTETMCLWGQALLADQPQTALHIFAKAIRSNTNVCAEAFEGLGNALDALDRHPHAILAYNQAIALAPKRLTAHCALGRTYRQMGCVAESIAALTQAINIAPDNAAGYFELGQSFAAQEQWDIAEQHLGRAVTLAPNSAEHLRWHGRALRHLGQLDAAALALERAHELDGSPATCVELAWLRRATGDAPGALAALDQAAHTAADANALLAVCRTLREFGEPGRAEDVLLSVEPGKLNLTPQQMAALQLELGQVRMARDKCAQALSAFEQAIALDPTRGEYHAALARALAQMEQAASAARHWEQARALGYETVDGLQDHAHILQRLDRHAEALAIYERLIELRPKQAEVYLAAAHTARNAGETDRALNLAGWATSLAPNLTPAYVLIGEMRMERGQPAQALEALARAARLVPGERPVWLGLAHAALDSGQAETALQAAQALLARDAADADAYLVAGTAHLTRQEWQAAVQSFAAALEHHPADADAVWGLARALAALGIRAEIAERENLAGGSILSLSKDVPLHASLFDQTQSACVSEQLSKEFEMSLAALRQLPGATAPSRVSLEAVLLSLRGEKEAAARRLKTALAGAGASAETLVWMAIVWRRAGAPRLGLEAAQQAVQLNRRDALPVYQLGALWEELDSTLRQARAAYRRAVDLEPGNSLYAHALARMHIRLGEWGLARQSLEAALGQLQDAAPNWYVELGEVCSEQNDLEAAAHAFEQACRLQPDAGAAHRQLGQIYARQGRHAAAVTELETAIRHAPHQIEWWVELGALHHESGAGGRALLCYKQALERAPDDSNLALSAAQLAGELNRWDEALAIITDALSHTPDGAALHARAGILYERLGQFEQALAAYMRAAQLAPNVAGHHLEAGRLALQLGRANEAAGYLEKSVAIDRTRRDALGFLGDAYLALGRQDEALQVYQHAATLEPGSVAHRLRLGRLYHQRNDYGQALAHLEIARSLAPDDLAVLEEMLAVFEAQREYRAALGVCLRLVELRAEASDCFHAGLLYKQLKAYPEALDMFKRASRLAPGHAEAYKQIAVVSAIGFFLK